MIRIIQGLAIASPIVYDENAAAHACPGYSGIFEDFLQLGSDEPESEFGCLPFIEIFDKLRDVLWGASSETGQLWSVFFYMGKKEVKLGIQ